MINVYLDGQSQYIRPIEPNFANHHYIAAYMSLFTGSGKFRQDEGNGISREDYPGGYAIYVFDLSPDLNQGDHMNLNRHGSLRLDLKFANPLPNTINVIAYGELENVIEIDRNKNILFDYSN